MRRLRYVWGIFWSFRLYIACAAVALSLWDTLWLKPFRIFVVLFHESCHAAAALATGGEVVEMRTRWDEGGHTLTRGGFFPLISAAGYLGSAFMGSLLIYTGSMPQLQRLLLLVLGGGCMGLTMWYTPAGEMDFYLGIFGGLLLAGMALYSARSGEVGAVWMGVVLCLYSLHDFYSDFSRAHLTDAGILADYLGWPLPWGAYPIALAWTLVSVSAMYRSMRSLVRHKKG